MKKRFISMLTAIIMIVGLVGVMPAVNAGAAGGVKQKLDSFISSHPSGSRWTDSFDGGKQCYGFAKLVVYNVFGKSNSGKYRSWKYNGTPTSGMTVIGSVKSYSKSSVKNLLSKAKCGDVLQFDQTKQHSMIVYKVESDGVVIYDCNWDNNCGIRKKKCSFGAWSGRNSDKLTLLRSDNYSNIDGKTHTVDNSYEKNITAYLKDPNKHIPVYTSCGVVASGHYITGKDPVTIKEVYTDGCCKVSYKTDSGSTKTYLSKISYFNIHTHSYTKRLYEPDHPHRISERCSCGAWRWTNEYYKLRTCEKCWDIKFNSSPTSIKVKVGENASLSLSIKGSIYPETAKYNCKYDDSIIDVTVNGNNYTIKGKKAGNCTLVFTAYADKTLSKVITKLSIPVTVTAHVHSYTSKITKQPTCTASGVKTYTCSVCGDNYKETIPKTSHTYDSGKITKSATCTTDGIKTYICTSCGFTKKETVLATGHKYSTEWTIDKTATCTEKGSKSHHCTVCGDKKDVTEVAATGHKYVTSVVNPTETEKGYTLHRCSICGESYKDNYVDPLEPDEPIEARDPNSLNFGATIIDGGSSKSEAEEIDFSVVYGVELQKEETRWFKFTTNDSDRYWYNLSVKDVSVGSHNQGGSGISGKIVDSFDEQYSSSYSIGDVGADGAKLEGLTVYYVAIYGCRKGNIKFQLDADYDEFGETEDEAKTIDFDTSYVSRIDSRAELADDRIGNGLDGDVDVVKFYTGNNTKVKFTLTNVDIEYYNSYFEGVAGIIMDNLGQHYVYVEVGPNSEKSIEIELETNTYYYIKIFATSGGVGNYRFKCGLLDGDDPTDPTEPTTHLGDLSGDGQITTADVGIINSFARGVTNPTPEQLALADANSDGKITTVDVGLVNAHAKGVSRLW